MLFSKTLAPLRYLDGPQESKEILVELTEYGKIADKYIKQLNDFYENISIDDYVIMPNHIHLLINVRENGPSRPPVPTELVCVKKSMQNSVISRFVSTFKRFSNKEIGKNIWQMRSFDHIIRDNKDYEFHIKYIHENPLKWYFNSEIHDDVILYKQNQTPRKEKQNDRKENYFSRPRTVRD